MTVLGRVADERDDGDFFGIGLNGANRLLNLIGCCNESARCLPTVGSVRGVRTFVQVFEGLQRGQLKTDVSAFHVIRSRERGNCSVDIVTHVGVEAKLLLLILGKRGMYARRARKRRSFTLICDSSALPRSRL